MTPYQSEELENIRRTAERGKTHIEKTIKDTGTGYGYLDLFIHILDTVERVKKAEQKTGICHPDCQTNAYWELNRDCNCDQNYDNKKA